MNTNDIKDYSKIVGFSFLAILKFAVVGIIISWAYCIFKIEWYKELFSVGGWWSGLAIAVIAIFALGLPALYLYMGYRRGISDGVIKSFTKNKEGIAHLLTNAGNKIANQSTTNNTATMAATVNEYKMARMIVNLMGFKKQWNRIVSLKEGTSPQTKQQVVNDTVHEIMEAIPQKIAAGFSYKLKQVILYTVIFILLVEIIARIYPN